MAEDDLTEDMAERLRNAPYGDPDNPAIEWDVVEEFTQLMEFVACLAVLNRGDIEATRKMRKDGAKDIRVAVVTAQTRCALALASWLTAEGKEIILATGSGLPEFFATAFTEAHTAAHGESEVENG